MGIGAGLWVVRYRSKSSKPMKLPKAKQYALELVKGVRQGKVVDDQIRRLNQLNLDVLEPMPNLGEVWAIETANYPPVCRPTPAPVSKWSAPASSIEHVDGYPKLPDCLRRNHG